MELEKQIRQIFKKDKIVFSKLVRLISLFDEVWVSFDQKFNFELLDNLEYTDFGKNKSFLFTTKDKKFVFKTRCLRETEIVILEDSIIAKIIFNGNSNDIRREVYLKFLK